jgi:polyisoprenoid-binding protein YceI
MRTSVFVLLLSALVAVGCSKATDSKSPGPQTNSGTPGGDKSGTPAGGPVDKIEFVGTKPEGKHDGGFKSFTVNVAPIPKEDLAGCKITVEIDTDSLWADNPKLTAHLKSPDFFEVRKYPKATFVSSSVEPQKSGDSTHKITGDLTLHGKTKTISFPAKVAVTPETVSITSQFTINRHDYGISYGRGKVHDNVTIKAALRVARK